MVAVSHLRLWSSILSSFVPLSSALMDVSLEVHWVPGHNRHRQDEGARRRLHDRANKEARQIREWASRCVDNWHRAWGAGSRLVPSSASQRLPGLGSIQELASDHLAKNFSMG